MNTARLRQLYGEAGVRAAAKVIDYLDEHCRAPKTVTLVRVEVAFLHCGKALMRSGLWKPETWPAKRPVAGLGDVIQAQTAGMDVPHKTEADVDRLIKESLY